MVIHVFVHVEQADAGALDGVAERTDQRAITSFADVGDAFEECVR